MTAFPTRGGLFGVEKCWSRVYLRTKSSGQGPRFESMAALSPDANTLSA